MNAFRSDFCFETNLMTKNTYVVNFPIDELKEAIFMIYVLFSGILIRFLYAKTKEASIETV